MSPTTRQPTATIHHQVPMDGHSSSDQDTGINDEAANTGALNQANDLM